MATQPVRDVFESAAATYDAAAFPFFTPFGTALVEHAQIQPHERILDAGCGTGAVLGPASELAASAVGVELSDAMAARARAAAPKAEVVVGDAGALDFPADSFDVVLSGFVVFFMPDPTAALREWKRVLAADGRLVLSTWTASDPRWSAWERPLRQSYVPEMDQAKAQRLGAGLQVLDRFTTAEKVEAELRAGGFTDVEVVEHALEFVFGDAQAWWDWNWSHGSRMYLETLGEDARRRFMADVEEGMEAVRDERGYPRTYTALFARARPA